MPKYLLKTTGNMKHYFVSIGLRNSMSIYLTEQTTDFKVYRKYKSP